ncbi:MAG: hypothetical protein JKY65_16440 [Planctomycetes bacterium]|nr:hypothetical protein [Planctomycetota bacterium]
MRTRVSLIGAALLSIASLASADVWSDALVTELAKRSKAKVVLDGYEAVIQAKHAHAADACWRRVQILATLGRTPATKTELSRMSKEFPKRYAKVTKGALADVPAFVKSFDRKAIKKILDSRKVTLNFPQTPISEVVSFLQDITGVNVVLLPNVDPNLPISLRLRNVSLKNALKLILATDGDLEQKIVRNVLVIGKDMTSIKPKKWTKKEIESNPDAVWAVLTRVVTLNFDQTPFEQFAGFISDITGTKITLSKTVKDANPDVSIRVKNARLLDVYTLICGSQGFRWTIGKDGVRIDAR